MRLRSLLYVPAHMEKFTARAHERVADAVILDLEDAVPEEQKDAARAALTSAAPVVGQDGARAFVRVNAGARATADAETAPAAGADGLLLPEAEAAADVDALRGAVPVIAIVEDARALLDAREIAAHPRVIGLCLGGEDTDTDTDARPEANVLRLPKLMLRYAAKAESKLSPGLPRSIGQFRDIEGLTAAAEEAVRFGFDGASCIRPLVVPVLNAAFAPDEARIDHARRVIAASDTAAAGGRGALMPDGEFIDAPVVAPVVARARRVLARAGLAE